MACNIDNLFICVAAKDPEIDFDVINLMILNAVNTGITPTVIINKCDLLSQAETDALISRLSFLGLLNINHILVSTFAKQNIDTIKQMLPGRISVFGGPSGVGKSSIVNTIQSSLVLETGDISKKTSRGKHTTKETSLIKLENGGYVVDTPGFGFLEPPQLKTKEDLWRLFPELRNGNPCFFRNCSHISEPKCGIKELVLSDTRYKERYNFYIKMFNYFKERWSTYD